MSEKYLFGSLIALCLLLSGPIHAGSSLNILKLSGSEKAITASSLRTITFSGNNLNLNYQDGNTEAIALADIQKLFFSSLSNSLEMTHSNLMVVFPNPVAQTLYLKNIPEGATLATIWHISGRKMLQISLSTETNSLDVSVLPSGLYLLKIQDQTIRFSKK